MTFEPENIIRPRPSMAGGRDRTQRRELGKINDAVEQIIDALGTLYTAEEVDEFLLDFDSIPMRVERQTGQTIPSGVATPIEWDTKIFDTYAYWDSAQADRVTFHIGGVYMLRTQVVWGSPAGAGASLELNFNLVRGGASQSIGRAVMEGNTTVNESQDAAAWFSMLSGDYVEVLAIQDSGADLGIIGNPRLEVMRISPSSEPRANVRGFGK